MDDKTNPSQPGRTRTWWHPLLARTLAWLLEGVYQVEEEVSVGSLPLRIDFRLKRVSNDIKELSRRLLPELYSRLRNLTFIEFKGPTDTLAAGDCDRFIGQILLYLSEHPEVDNDEVSLIIMAPHVTTSFITGLEKRRLRLVPEENEAGVRRIEGSNFDICVVETDVMEPATHPVGALFSQMILRDRKRIIEELRSDEAINVLRYLLQQIEQFRRMGKDWAMQFTDVAQVNEIEEIRRDIMRMCTPEERVSGLTAEQRMEGLSPEDRLAGLSPEEFVRGLSAEKREALKKLRAVNYRAAA